METETVAHKLIRVFVIIKAFQLGSQLVTNGHFTNFTLPFNVRANNVKPETFLI